MESVTAIQSGDTLSVFGDNGWDTRIVKRVVLDNDGDIVIEFEDH